MHLLARLCAALACALCLSTPPAYAQAPAADVSAAIVPTAEEAAIIASPRWRDLVTLLREVGFRGAVDEPAMVAACHERLAEPRSADFSPDEACLSSALWSWDSSSAYFPAAATARNRRTIDQPLIGVGLELARKSAQGPIRVVATKAGGPGERMGIRAGDLIVRIDGRAVAPLTMAQAIAAMRGELDSVVHLQLERGASRQKLSVDVVRERIHDVTVRRLPGTPRVAVLRFIWFTDTSVEEFATRVAEILHTTAPAPDTLVIDLRSCGGSSGNSLDAAIQLGGAFSTDGTVVARELTRHGELALTAATSAEPHVQMPVAARQWMAGVRIALLVDASTGGEAEALAQFLREQRGARMFGGHTYGIAGVRTKVNIGDDVEVRIRTGRLISSRRVEWEEGGLVPDVVLPEQRIDLPWSAYFGSAADTALAAVLRSAETRQDVARDISVSPTWPATP